MEQRVIYRVSSIDILRGIVMIIMALDHTRDFFHATAVTNDPLDLATTTVPLFFTRWITHYCAPTFVFLSGTSAYLASKNKAPGKAGLFLIKRGLWLVFIEMAVITLGLTFNPIYSFIIWQVIWAIGWSMVILGLLIRLPLYAILVTGIFLFFGHDLFDYLSTPVTGVEGTLIKILFTAKGTVFPITAAHFIGDFYAILPWTGVMLLGYCTGFWFRREFDPQRRKKLLLTTGLLLIVLFIVLRFFNWYGDPDQWDKKHFLSFLNVNKYPPSLLYLCVTLGPALIALALLENIRTGWSGFVSAYGKVPFFYYVLHFYILHLLLVIIFFIEGYGRAQIVDMRIPFLFRPLNFGFGLVGVYIIWLSVVLVLYQPCRWFNRYKNTHTQWWLKYL